MLIVYRAGHVRVHPAKDGRARRQAEGVGHKSVPEHDTFAADAINVGGVQEAVSGE